ncbi:hypothetical protein PV325_000764 [Microctonus aethiopoides]|nr:hypothetical protein PV325_000764 [Microctonus aethiopoides]
MIDIIDICKDISDCADNSFILLTMVGILFKMLNTLKNRKRIVDLVNRLQSNSFKPRNSTENKVINDFEYVMKWKTITFAVVLQLGTVNLIVQSLIYLAPHRMTITKLYLPWDAKTFIGYWTAWILQVFGRWLDGPIIVACDSLVSGILYRIAAQFKILQIRLHSLANLEGNYQDEEHWETKKMVELVKEHLELIQLIVDARLNCDAVRPYFESQGFPSSDIPKDPISCECSLL